MSTPEIRNRKVFHDYEIGERFEAGILLQGPEVKSLRAGAVGLRDSYVEFTNGEAFLIGMSISNYANRGYSDHLPFRPRKLLMHRRELKKIERKILEKSVTVVPLRIYFNNRGIAKVEIALATGKRQYDKRQSIAKRDAKRELDRATKEAGNR